MGSEIAQPLSSMNAIPHVGLLVLGVPGAGSFIIYVGAICVFLLSAFWRPQLGLYFLVPLLPLQTLRYQLHSLPFGEKLVDFLLLGVILGLFIRSKGRVFPQTPLNGFLIVWALFHYVSLWRGAFFLNTDLPFWITDPRFSNWKNYMIMPLIFIVVAAAIKDKRQVRILLFLMLFSVLRTNIGFHNTVAERDFSHFSYGLRYAGTLGYAGENGLAAFEAQLALFCFGLYTFERSKLVKAGLLAYILLCGYCLLFTFSRGGYLGFLSGLFFLGLVRERKLLILIALFLIIWQTVLPTVVTERILMTYDNGKIDSSAGERVTIWQDAMVLVPQQPIFGTGFDTYEFMGRVEEYRDTHNLYLKILVETGILGLLLFMVLLWKNFRLSFQLFRLTSDPLLKGIGLGAAACTVCAFMVNFFGDRWMYLQVNGYLWTMLGLVVRGTIIALDEKRQAEEKPEEAQLETTPQLAAAEA